jgi:hypothetical protein
LHAQVECNLSAANVAADALATLRTHTKAEAEQHLEDSIDIDIGCVAAFNEVNMLRTNRHPPHIDGGRSRGHLVVSIESLTNSPVPTDARKCAIR